MKSMLDRIPNSKSGLTESCFLSSAYKIKHLYPIESQLKRNALFTSFVIEKFITQATY